MDAGVVETELARVRRVLVRCGATPAIERLHRCEALLKWGPGNPRGADLLPTPSLDACCTPWETRRMRDLVRSMCTLALIVVGCGGGDTAGAPNPNGLGGASAAGGASGDGKGGGGTNAGKGGGGASGTSGGGTGGGNSGSGGKSGNGGKSGSGGNGGGATSGSGGDSGGGNSGTGNGGSGGGGSGGKSSSGGNPGNGGKGGRGGNPGNGGKGGGGSGGAGGGAGGTSGGDTGKGGGDTSPGGGGNAGGGGAAGSAGAGQQPNCQGMAPTCGPSGDASCCASAIVLGGTFHLGRKNGDPDYAPNGLPVGGNELPYVEANVSTYRLDVYEVTVGRFRTFVAVYDVWRMAGNPAAHSGKHAYLPGGGLNAGAETGWDPAWNTNLPANSGLWDSHLLCRIDDPTWTPDASGGHESRPINCVNWHEAYAFCIWDGGFLPTEAEWELAASGGEERVFPWSSPANSALIDCSHANYHFPAPGPASCEPQTFTANVGSRSPTGDGKWGHADLAGNVSEWALDLYSGYPSVCNDCADLSAGTDRVVRGGSFHFLGGSPSSARAASRSAYPSLPDGGIGFRCARAPLSVHGAPANRRARTRPTTRPADTRFALVLGRPSRR